MIITRKIKRHTSYVAILTLIIQMGFASLICATSSNTANANTITICTSFGIKTVTIDEDGNLVEEEQQQAAFSHGCFHCTSGCNGGASLLTADLVKVAYYPAVIKAGLDDQNYRFGCIHSANASRGPPLSI